MVEVKGVEPFHPYENGVTARRASPHCAALPCVQYRQLLVCAVGFEPTTPRFQTENSDQTELRTVILGRGRDGVFMMGKVYQELAAHIKQCL